MKDVAESVLARLLNIARANGLVYNELLMRYILERIFYRVGKSRHSGKFILKGGNLFVCWQGGFDFRPTMDADMLYRGVGTPEHIKAAFTEICTAEVPDDGLRIDVASMTAMRILKDFYDMWKLKSLFDYDIDVLGRAIARTFERRKRLIPTECPAALTERFWSDPVKQKQWQAFLRKSRLDVGNRTLGDIVHEISDFLTPVVDKLNA